MRLVFLALGWAAGIALVLRVNRVEWVTWLLFIAATLLLLLWPMYRRHRRLLLAVGLAVVLGAARALFIDTTSEIAQLNGVGGMTIEGVVISEPDVRDDRVLLRVDVETVSRIGQTVPMSGRVLVEVLRPVTVRFGDRITATGAIFTPQEFDTFSYSDFLARQGVFSVMENAALEVQSNGHGNAFRSKLIELKLAAQQTIGDALPDPQAALLTGILLGNERGISPEVAEAFRAVGASHIIAISGFNMAIVSGLFVYLMRRTRLRQWAALVGIPIILLYTLFVGADAGVVRAAIMSSLLMFGVTLRRKTFVPASLGFVVIAMTLINPTVLWDVGFQLSFFAVLGMMLFVEPFATRISQVVDWLFSASLSGGFRAIVREGIAVTLAVQITVLPITLLHFQRISLVAPLVNVIIVPVQVLVLVLGGVATLLAFLPEASQMLYWLDYPLLTWTIEIVRLFAQLSFADVEFFIDPIWMYVYLTVLIAGAIAYSAQPGWVNRMSRLLRRRLVIIATGIIGSSMVVLMVLAFLRRPDGRLHVWLLPMGHSNAVLIQTSGGAQVLVDGGRFPSRLLTALGDRLPFNDRELDVLIITHPDNFDVGALTTVLGRYDVGIALTNGQPNQSIAIRELNEALTKTTVMSVTAGHSLEMADGTRIEILNPQRTPAFGESLNDHVIVFRISYGDISFLLTSDLSVVGQNTLLHSGQQLLASVMQLPRHGTTGSLEVEFLDAVQPQAIVLQSDRANQRNDPDPDTLMLLNEMPLFRTDDGGAIHLFTDGRELWVQQEG